MAQNIMDDDIWKHVIINKYGCWIWKPQEKTIVHSSRSTFYSAFKQQKIMVGQFLSITCRQIKCVNPNHFCVVDRATQISLERTNWRRYSRSEVWKRAKKMQILLIANGKVCQFCSASDNLIIDHLIPRGWVRVLNPYTLEPLVSDNYPINKIQNLQLLCEKCNAEKHKFELILTAEFRESIVDRTTQNYIQLLQEYCTEKINEISKASNNVI